MGKEAPGDGRDPAATARSRPCWVSWTGSVAASTPNARPLTRPSSASSGARWPSCGGRSRTCGPAAGRSPRGCGRWSPGRCSPSSPARANRAARRPLTVPDNNYPWTTLLCRTTTRCPGRSLGRRRTAGRDERRWARRRTAAARRTAAGPALAGRRRSACPARAGRRPGADGPARPRPTNPRPTARATYRLGRLLRPNPAYRRLAAWLERSPRALTAVHRGRATQQGSAVRLPDVRPVRAARHRLRLPDELPQAAAQRPLRRRLAGRAVRGLPHRTLRLGDRLRAGRERRARGRPGPPAAPGRPPAGRLQLLGQLLAGPRRGPVDRRPRAGRPAVDPPRPGRPGPAHGGPADESAGGHRVRPVRGHRRDRPAARRRPGRDHPQGRTTCAAGWTRPTSPTTRARTCGCPAWPAACWRTGPGWSR